MRERSPEGPLTEFLGWFSLGLGAPQVLDPATMCRAIGVKPTDSSRRWMRIVGVRELIAGAGILGFDRPTAVVWGRVAGDVKGLALLASAWRGKPADRTRLAVAIGSVAAVALADVADAVLLTKRARERRTEVEGTQTSPAVEQEHRRTVVATTVRGSVEEVQRQWAQFADRSQVEEAGSLRFSPAPGDRGTEIRVQVHKTAPLGALGRSAQKLRGMESGQVVDDALRRFKQVVETGVLVRSDGSPEGSKAVRQFKQRPAHPVGAEERSRA